MIRPTRRSLLAAALPTILSACLAACGPNQPERQFSADADSAITGQFIAGQTLSAPITARAEASNFAVVALPEAAGRGGKVAEKQFLNGWRQSMSLDRAKMAGDWNDLTIEIQAAAPGEDRRGQMRIAKPTAEGVRREILARFRGAPMRIVNRPMQNRLGPFGLAVGAGAGGIRCAFAWQWVDNIAVAARGERVNFFNSGETPASIRLRLCRRGVTADDLAMWYEQLEVDPANIARIAEAMRQNAQTQSIDGGAQAVDASDSLEATLIGDRREAAPRAGGARRRVAHRPRRAAPFAEPETEAPMTTPSSPSASGPRYLGAVGQANPQYVSSAPIGSRGAGFGPVRLDPGLPAQAYRGPATARAIVPPSPGGAPVYLGPTQ